MHNQFIHAPAVSMSLHLVFRGFCIHLWFKHRNLDLSWCLLTVLGKLTVSESDMLHVHEV